MGTVETESRVIPWRRRRWTGKQAKGKRKHPDYHRLVYAECGERIPPWILCSHVNITDNPRARTALHMVAYGWSNAHIARTLGIAEKTVSRYKNHPDGRQMLRRIHDELDEFAVLEAVLKQLAIVKAAKRKG